MNSKPSIPGFSSPAAGPEHPLERLSACHERVERQCVTLERLVAYLQTHAVDVVAADAAAAVIAYFEKAAANHHADEEIDLFPALREAVTGGQAQALQHALQDLERQHVDLGQQWATLHASLQRIVQQASVELDAHVVERFVVGYRAHMAIEESQVLPLARQCLQENTLQQIGLAMSRRRGLHVSLQ